MSRYINVDELTYSHTKDGDVVIYPEVIAETPSIDIVRCKECIYYDPPHVENHGKRIEYADLPEEAFDGGAGVNVSHGVNVGGRCRVDYNCGYAEDKRVYRAENNFCGRGRRKGASNARKANNRT